MIEILLATIFQINIAQAQISAQDVFLPKIGQEQTEQSGKNVRRRFVDLSSSNASEGTTATNNNAGIKLDPVISESIGYLAIGGALLFLYKLLLVERLGRAKIEKEATKDDS